MKEIRCSRCGHVLSRRKYARQPTPHSWNPQRAENECGGCRDCYVRRSAEG